MEKTIETLFELFKTEGYKFDRAEEIISQSNDVRLVWIKTIDQTSNNCISSLCIDIKIEIASLLYLYEEMYPPHSISKESVIIFINDSFKQKLEYNNIVKLFLTGFGKEKYIELANLMNKYRGMITAGKI
jgi:hypothetical protein